MSAALAGCLYVEDDLHDPLVRARLDAEEAAKGITTPRRSRLWFIVKAWVREVPRDAEAAESLVVHADAEREASLRAAGLRASFEEPPEAPHSSILLREGERGFVAVARGEALHGFRYGRKSVVGDSPMDRGLAVEVAPSADGSLPASCAAQAGVRAELAPLFRETVPGGLPASGGEELIAETLSFRASLGGPEALRLEAAPGAADPVIRSLFFDRPPPDGHGRRRVVWLRVETFR
jgi:hypothetical protein